MYFKYENKQDDILVLDHFISFLLSLGEHYFRPKTYLEILETMVCTIILREVTG